MKNSLNFFITALLFIVFSTTAVYAQPANDNCSTATAIGILPIPTACGTGIGVNTGATITLNNQTTAGATAANPYVYLTSCSGGGSTQVPGLDTWYSFVASGSVVNITVSDFPNASLGLWAGSNCTTLRGAGCTIIPNSGTGTLTVSSIEIGKTYYIQISGNSSTATDSNFSIAINNSIDCDDCLRVSTLTPSPLPVSGIYSPGQVVRFCYTISQWKATNGNWLHGVQIKMGAGWTGTISNTTPATSYVTGNWVFRPTVLVANGTNWDPGFYFNDGTNNWGDYRSIPQNWTFCFDLTVGSSCTSGDDLSVIINTSGDGESGSYPNPGCQQDPQNFLTNVKSQGPIMTSAIAATVCSGTTNFPLTSNVPATYNWIATDNPNVTGESLISQNSNAISDNLVNISNVSQVVTYSVTATSTATGCVGVPQIISITVKPSPVAITPTSFSVCPGAIVPVANFVSLPVGGTFIWTNNTPSIGLAASGTNFVPSFVAVNATSFPITATISVISTLNGCVGNAVNYTITINPNPTVSVPSPLIYCNNEPVPSIVLVSTLLGATYSWSIDDTSIGLPAGGTGNIPGFTAINSSLNPVTATISVVPTLNGCSGSTNAFTITVKPTPTVTVPSNDIYCVNATVPATAFVSSPTLGTFTWTNNNSNIGLTTNGTGDIASFVTTNSTANAITSTIIVTPTVNGCLGTSSNYTITVDAIPTVTTPTSAAYCNGATVPAATFASATTGATFDWTNDDNTIGLASSGTGNIPAFTAVNTTIFPIIATITVTPTTANGCVGTPFDYTITVNPTPTVAVPVNDIYCNNTLVPATLFANTPAGGTFAWTNDNINIGLAASGAGDIASFTATNITNAPIIANISVTPTVNGCVGTASSYSITVDPSPTVSVPTSVIYCNADSVLVTNFVSLPAGGTFAWTNDNTNIGLTASGTGDISSFVATNTTPNQITANITVTATVNGCLGIPNTYTVKVDPTPTVATPTSAPYCNNALVPTAIFTSATTGATFTWTNDNSNIGLAANGTGDILAFTATNTTNAPILATITVTPFTVNGCAGTPSSYSITVNPTPTVTVPANNNYCVNATVPATAFVSSPTLGTFTWTNNNANIGLTTNGTGDIASFVTTNTSVNAITSTIIVTPTVNGCLGTSSNYTITVDAIPTVTTPTNAAYCNGAIVPAATFTSATTGATFDWTNDDNTIGLASSGTGNIPAFTAVNTTIFPIIATITVTPTTANGCVGTPKNYTITVNPTPTVAVPANDIYCNNTLVPATLFANTPAGGTFAWTNDNINIGLLASGNGDIAAFTATNTTNATIIANISVTPTVNGCVGTASSYSITVDPSPTVSVPTSVIYCNSDSVLVTNFVSSPAGGTFAWTNDNTNIGLALNGTGDISSFLATNTTPNQITANITVTATVNGCLGISNTYTVKVDPTPTVATPANTDYCNNALVPTATFTSATTGATFTWTNDNSNIGLAANGTGDIVAFTATNTTNAPILATITVTPITANGCVGTPSSYSITVNPTPTVTVPSNNNYCVNATVLATAFVSSPTLGTFTWTNNNSNIGLTTNGSGDIPSFVTTNSTANAITATIIVTPTVNGCLGTSSSYSITVDAIPTVTTPSSAAFCNGANVPAAIFASATTGATFDWTNDETTIGLAASGTGNIPSFTAVNTTIFPIIATITVTPTTANGCVGTPFDYTITVNPTPTVAVPVNDIYCNNTLVPATLFANTPAGGTFAWTNDNINIGLAASGAGDIASFTATNITNAPIIANISVTPTVNGCVGTASSYSITVDPSPTVSVPISVIYCNADSVLVTNFVSSPAGGTFAWTNDNTNIGLTASGTGDISSFVATNTTPNQITANITVTATVNGCLGIPNTYTVKVDPTPTVSTPTSAPYCNNALVPTAIFTSATTGATFTWTNDNSNIGLAANGTGDILAFTATNTTNAPILATITVTPFTVNGCAGTPSSYSITVNPTPTVTVPANNIYCVNATVPATAFVSSPTLGTFTWTNNNVNIGLLPNGTGDIASFVATNSTANAITSTIIVTPTVNGCLGTSSNYTITVDAIPTVTTPTSAAYCNGAIVPAATFTSATTGATFDWTNDDNTIGLASSGTGNIPAFTAVNTTIFPIIATITVTPTTANGCVGTPFDYTITVNPTPTVAVPVNDIYCNNTLVPATLFANTPAGGTFAWTNDNINIGLAASGAGDIAAFTATNITNAPIIANISVTPTVNGCVGTASSYSITVDPSPTVSVPISVIYCNADSVLVTNFVSLPAGGTFAWTNDNTNIGLTASGTGDISSFVATNTTPNQITANITVTATVNGCSGIPNTYTVKVDPTPTVATPTSAPYCNNALVPTAIFTSTTTGATFTWTNDNSNIGLAANGTGDILAFTATNTTNAPILATITVTPFTVNGCAGTPSSYSITVNPTPTVTVPANNNYCVNATVPATAFVSSPTLGTFTWTNNNSNIGLTTNGTGDIASFVTTNSTANAITSTIIVTPTVNGCLGTSSNYTITVDAIPTVTTPTSAAYCNGATVPAATFTSATTGATFDWTNDDNTIGLASSGTGNILAFTAVNTTIFPIIATITVTPTTANGCVGTPFDYTITVNPTPTVAVPANDIYCNNTLVPATLFANTPAGGTFAWTNDNINIGLLASGNGDITAFTATNITNAPIIANINVTPTVNGCVGTASSYSITVDPSPTVSVPTSVIYCNADSVLVTNFVSLPAGGTFAWTNDNTNIGLTASGTGDISSFVATNTTPNQITANITVTATVNGCLGIPNTYTVKVDPTPTVATPTSAPYCNNALVPTAIFTSTTTGATFTWTNDNSNIGLAANGTGDILAFTATNTTNAPILATITVTPFTVNGCAGTPSSYSITVNPTPTVTVPSNNNYCVNATVPATAFVSSPTLGTFTWTNNNSNIGLTTNGTGDIASFVTTNTSVNAITSTIIVTPTVNGCLGTSSNYTITVDAIPTVTTPTSAAYCNGATVPVATFTSATTGATFDWTNDDNTIGLASSGTGNIPAFTAVNTTIFPIIATITVTPTTANGCVGTPFDYTITVNPTPTVAVPANDIYCNNTLVPATLFANTPAGGTFAWTNDNINIGLAASGAGDIASFTATNITNAPIIANISVTPTVNGCVGTASSYSITVDPSPTVSVPTSVIYCNADSVLVTNFVSLPAGGTFAWTNDNTNIGLTASGTGDISSFLATNTTPNQITANITVTATVNGCSGIPNTYTVKVDPTPTVATPTSAPYCNNALVPTAIFTSATTGATFTWTNDNSNIGLAANGTGNIVAFTATNTTNAPILATITVTPFTVNGCAGTPSSYSITVNPTPTVTVPANNIYCVNATVPATAFVSSPTLGTFTWTNNNVNIGLLPNGTGDIASFVATNSTANAITSTIIVTPTVNGCLGTSSSYSITVDAIPTVTTPTNAAYCNGAIVPAATFASLPTGGTFTWTNSNSTVGLLLTSGVGNIPSFVATNATNSPITTLITVIPTVNGCTGTPSDYIITVNPSLTFTPPGNAIYCNNGVVPTTTFSSSATGVIYNWTNDTPSIGIGLNGTGSIPSFLALNTTLIPITATITVTPLFNGCIGIQSTFTITVNPTPAVTVPINNSYCTTSSVPATAFVGTLPGTTFSWTNSNTNIGLSASAGSGNIGAFIATNTSANPIIAVISVTATANGCSGTPNTYTITVNPTPTVTAVAASNSICTSSTTGIALTGTPIIGTTFAWTAVASAGVTGASSGTGILISQALINLGTTIGNVVYTITPTANNCPGTPINISIDVTPRPTISATPLSQNICSGNAPNINLLSDVLITNFNWTVIPNNVTGASAGSGNLISQPLTAIGLTAGQAIYTVTPNVNGCTGNPIIVTVVVSPIPVVIALPLLGDTICSGQRTNVTLTGGNPGTTFSWNSIPIGVSGATSGTTSIIAQTLTTTSAVQGNVIYTITPSLNGCLGLPLPYPIVVNPTPQFLNIPPQLPICSGDTTSINLVPSISIPLGTTYDWTVIENGVSGATDGNGILINQTLDATGTSAGTATYNVIPTLGTCSGNSINIIANVNPLPIPDLTDGVICVSASGSLLNPYLITTGIPNSNHSHVWYLNNAPIIPSAVGNNYLATIIGDYSVTIIANATGCIASQTLATATVTAKSPGLTLTAFASNEFSENAIITANVNGGTGVFEYSLDNGPFQLSNIFTEVLPGNHIVTVRDTSGCTDLSTNVVVMGYQLFFTPNGDTYNDYWNIIGLKDQPNAKIYIFDRYGKLITQINTKTNGWDGKVNGSDLPASDYWFSVEYLDLTTLETKIFKSHFSLKR